MNFLPQINQKSVLWLAILLLLLACNIFNTPELPAPDVTPLLLSPSAVPPTETTSNPETTATPTTAVPEPTIAAPEPVSPALLPAALYFLNTEDQIMRLAADGLSLTQITNEPEPVISFDVSQTTGNLAYVSGNNLIETDGNGGSRFVKVAGEAFDPDVSGDSIIKEIKAPRYSPDGTQIAFGLNGVNIIASGAATDYQVVVPSDPYPDISDLGANVEQPIRFFHSGEWSPDAAKLVVTFSYFPEAGGMAVKNLVDGTLTELVNSAAITCCEWGWTADSSTGYVASNVLAYGSPGLARFDASTGQGTMLVAGLPPDGAEPNPENPIRLFESAFVDDDGSILTFAAVSESFDQFNRPSVYTMYRIDPNSGALTSLRSDSYPIWEALWAEDGSGAVIVDTLFDQRYPLTGPMRWLPTDGGPALNLPADGSRPRWGGPAVAVSPSAGPSEADFANLKSRALADFGFQLSDSGINDLAYGGFNMGDGRSLWYIYTVGFRDFTLQRHAVGVYAFENGGWQRLDSFVFPDFEETAGIPGPDYMNQGSVQQVFIEPSNGWLSVEGGIGAHGGTLHVLRFDGQSLTLEAENSNGNPVAGKFEDINGDGRQEVLLDLSDFYIFAYAAGVRLINYDILYWDGSGLSPIALTRLENTNAATDLNNQAINLTEAQLWKDAREIINQAKLQTPDNETIGWNAAYINAIADARENAGSSFPIMDKVFLGDYDAVIDMMRGYSAADIFNRQSPLIVGTVAEGSEDAMAEQIQEFANLALTLKPDLAAAHFLRGWAAYLLNPNDPAALAEVQQAAVLAPDEPLYTNAVAYLQP